MVVEDEDGGVNLVGMGVMRLDSLKLSFLIIIYKVCQNSAETRSSNNSVGRPETNHLVPKT